MNRMLIRMLALATAITVANSCKNMDDTYYQFIESGETIYIAKADSIKIKGGNLRAEVSWLLLADPKVDQYKLYWNNGRDSMINNVTKTSRVDTVRIMLDDIGEGTHHFEIFMLDKYGNSSIPARQVGKVYGPRYQQSLLNRTFRSIRRIGDDIEINWMPSELSLIRVEISYEDRLNNMVTHIVSPDTELDTLKGYPVNGKFDYRSVFLPDTMALDTFYTSYTQIQY